MEFWRESTYVTFFIVESWENVIGMFLFKVERLELSTNVNNNKHIFVNFFMLLTNININKQLDDCLFLHGSFDLAIFPIMDFLQI